MKIPLAMAALILASCSMVEPRTVQTSSGPRQTTTLEQVGETMQQVGDGGTPWGSLIVGVGGLLTGVGAWFRLRKGDRDHSYNELQIDQIRAKANNIEKELLNLKEVKKTS